MSALLAALLLSLSASAFDHSAFDALLKKRVKGDRVDYAALKADRKELDAYCERLAKLPAADLEQMARADQMAFWINAYNALTLRSIIDHYPIVGTNGSYPKSSIRQIDKVWEKEQEVAGRKISLDAIENKVLRPTFKDPRIHAAINCASRGCPPLRAEAFTGAQLESQLDDNVRRFLADPARNQIDPEQKSVRLSKVFDWFKEDFGGAKGVLEFVRKYAPEGTKSFLAGFDAEKIDHLDYDWTLNDV